MMFLKSVTMVSILCIPAPRLMQYTKGSFYADGNQILFVLPSLFFRMFILIQTPMLLGYCSWATAHACILRVYISLGLV